MLLSVASLEEMADMLIPMAKRAAVPVVVHLDHGLKDVYKRQRWLSGRTPSWETHTAM